MPLNTNIIYQLPLMLQCPTVYGPKEFNEFRDTLIHMSRMLEQNGLEFEIISANLKSGGFANPSNFDIENRRRMLRCSILKVLSGLDYRELSIRIAESELYQWFAGYLMLDKRRTPAKSTLERFCKQFSSEEIRRAINSLNRFVSIEEHAREYLDREAINFDLIFADSTCVKANIHFPVDWILLRDAVISLCRAIMCIRNQGLKNRMPSPEKFISSINSLCIEMANSNRKQDSKKQRKKTLRKMKEISRIIEAHANRYFDRLEKDWQQTEWTRKQAQQVLARIQNVIDKLPQAIHQANERIIAERKVPVEEKLLSLYEENVHVLIRGKANAKVEFGNGLYLAEQENGLIVDFDFFKEMPPHDSKIVDSSIKRITAALRQPLAYAADRGFHSRENQDLFEDLHIFNAVCPKSVSELKGRLNEDRFVLLQKRRAQTEGRIGILKKCYLGNPLLSKGFKNREQYVSLSVLVHNLWTLATMAREAEYRKSKEAA